MLKSQPDHQPSSTRMHCIYYIEIMLQCYTSMSFAITHNLESLSYLVIIYTIV